MARGRDAPGPEDLCHGGAGQPLGDHARFCPEREYRITSYNVCYTKLLRFSFLSVI